MDNIEVLKEIKNNLTNCQGESKTIENVKYYHNTSINGMTRIIRDGILTFEQMAIKYNYSKERIEKERYLRSDECFANGTDGVSISFISDEKENDRYSIYDPYYTSANVLLTIKKDIEPFSAMYSKNYINETVLTKYLSKEEKERIIDIIPAIAPDKFASLEIRILKRIKELISKDEKENISESDYEKLFKFYNSLIESARIINENNLDIIIKDMDKEIYFNPKKIAQLKRIRNLGEK